MMMSQNLDIMHEEELHISYSSADTLRRLNKGE
jgi:hypothetical protein